MIKVLLVDDHLIARNGVRLMLGTAPDIEIAGEAGTAREALMLVDQKDFDVALIDIALPDKNGLDLLKLIKARKPKLAVLMLSMYSEDVYAIRAIKTGASGYLTKDSSIATVVTAVRSAASGRKHLSPALAEKLVDMVSGGSSRAALDALSDRELEVMKMIVAGAPAAKIAETLHLSPHTVSTYRARIMEKMGFSSNVDLVRYAIDHHLVT